MAADASSSPLPRWAPTPSPSRPLWRWGGGTPDARTGGGEAGGAGWSLGRMFPWRRHPAVAGFDGVEVAPAPRGGRRAGTDAVDDPGPGVYLTWEDVCVTVAGGAYGAPPVSILTGISGHAGPGEVLAIMGPSGCGKTTLLDTLAGRLGPGVNETGLILINGRREKLAFGTSAYVTQDNVLMSTMSVREAVYYSAQLQLPGTMPAAEKRAHADGVIREMGLGDAMDTRIGGRMTKGISGGQRKRLTICVEMLTRPRLLFLDEPTSGLDSAASYHVMTHIARTAAKEGMTIVAAVHQPCGDVFDLFHSLCLLASGRTVFFGAASDATQFFTQSGFPCPQLRNPSDHFLRTINKDFDEEIVESSKARRKTAAEAIDILADAYQSPAYSEKTMNRIAEMKGIEDMADVSDESVDEYLDIVSRTFDSEEEGFQFYNSYALEKGFSVRKGYVEWDVGNVEIVLRKLVCSREGCREEKHMKRKREDRKRRPRNITRVGCKAKLVIARVEETGRWFVKDFVDEHTHHLAPPDLACLLRSHRRISDDKKVLIVEMANAGVRTHKIMDVLRSKCGGFDKVGCTTRDIYNFCHLYKEETVPDGDAQTVISHMMARQEKDPDFFFRYLVDKDGHLNGLFWSDSQSRLDYEAFGDVVVFDSTYRTNKYNMPFVPFVGVNQHRSTVIFGCGVISHETTEAYEWMLQTFSDCMSQKHPISVITDGDLAMQRAIRVIWPNSNHRLCVWHIQQNIVRNLHDDAVKEEFRSFIYDSSSIEQHERKWVEFLGKNKVTSEESWLHQMYQMRKLWCAPYLVGRCFLGLSSNQRSESLNSVLHMHLDGKMTLLKMLEHYERCLSTRRLHEAILDIVALQSVSFTEVNASSLEKHAAKVFTPSMFGLVRWSIDAVSNRCIIGILDGHDLTTFVVANKDKREKKFEVRVEEKEGSFYRISCSCRKLECVGTPCSHIFYVLGTLKIKELPKCCVLTRWTMSAKSAYPPTRKNEMYEFSVNLLRYRELRKLSNMACFRAAQSDEAYQHLKMVLNEQADIKESTSGRKECIRFGPVLPQTTELDSGVLGKVLDPLHVQGRGAPKKRLQAKMKKPKSKGKCGYCKEHGHNRRTCKKLKEAEMLPEH